MNDGRRLFLSSLFFTGATAIIAPRKLVQVAVGFDPLPRFDYDPAPKVFVPVLPLSIDLRKTRTEIHAELMALFNSQVGTKMVEDQLKWLVKRVEDYAMLERVVHGRDTIRVDELEFKGPENGFPRKLVHLKTTVPTNKPPSLFGCVGYGISHGVDSDQPSLMMSTQPEGPRLTDGP